MNKVLGYRKMLNFTQQQMAKELKISEQSYRNKEKGKTEFKKEEMLTFKNILISKGMTNITLDDIFFLKSDVKLRKRGAQMTKLAYPMLYITRKEKGDTQKKVASKLGISPQRYQLKESGKAIFNLNECQILSEMYDMPIDELFSSKIKVRE